MQEASNFGLVQVTSVTAIPKMGQKRRVFTTERRVSAECFLSKEKQQVLRLGRAVFGATLLASRTKVRA